MMSLFSPFDLGLYVFVSSLFFLYLSTMVSATWVHSNLNTTIKIPFKFLLSFFFSLKNKFMTKFICLLSYCVCMLIFLLNFSSILPYNFSMTSQPSLVFTVSASVWLSFVGFSLIKNFKGFLGHCIPEGSPIYLVSVLFIIELISNIIRPLTLTIRLVANILAGHLLMSLLGGLVLLIPMVFPVFAMLTMVEIFVSIIQSYIFSTMLILYYSEMF